MNYRCLAKYTVTIFIVFSISSGLLGRQYRQNDEIRIACSLPGYITRNSDLNLKIIIVNPELKSKVVYSNFIEGGFDDFLKKNRSNLKLIIQKKRVEKYRSYFNRTSIDAAPGNDTLNFLEKKTLIPKDSLINYFHVDELYKFEPGYYRLKCLYWNDINVNKSVASNWIYCSVQKTIYVNHYYNESNIDSAR